MILLEFQSIDPTLHHEPCNVMIQPRQRMHVGSNDYSSPTVLFHIFFWLCFLLFFSVFGIWYLAWLRLIITRLGIPSINQSVYHISVGRRTP